MNNEQMNWYLQEEKEENNFRESNILWDIKIEQNREEKKRSSNPEPISPINKIDHKQTKQIHKA